MKNEHPENVLSWLQSKPSLDDLGAAYPELREVVKREIAEIVTNGTAGQLPVYLRKMAQDERLLEKKFRSSRGDKKIAAVLVQQAVRTRMAHLAVKQHLISVATGIEKGKIRFNLLNGYVAQKLLFAEGLQRKPISMFWFRLFWPLLPQKRLLMPLVQPEGIYCFYSRQLIERLVEMIATRSCLEIAAGDGTLTRFLADRGISITATDNYSWQHEVHYPEFVVKKDAGAALREYAPKVVLCSWPPTGNSFEQQVFRTKSVQLYIVIGSRHRFAAGNWDEYQQQTAFSFAEDQLLSSLVLPPELDAAVYVFRRELTV
jgi:hypothetical protein